MKQQDISIKRCIPHNDIFQLNKRQVEHALLHEPAALHTKPFTSAIMSPEMARRLMCYLPDRFQIVTPERIYHHAEAGISFKTLWAWYYFFST